VIFALTLDRMNQPSLNYLKPRLIWILLICVLFLFLSYDDKHGWDENDFVFKAAFAPFDRTAEWFCQPDSTIYGWYRNKIGNLYLLNILIKIFGIGRKALFLVDFIYALMMLGVSGFAYGIFRKIGGTPAQAFGAAVFTLFLPTSLYLAFKPYGEPGALFFICLSIWLFLCSLRFTSWKRWFLYLFSALAFMIATTFRLDVFILFYGLGLGLLAAREKRFWSIIRRYFEITIVIILVVLLYYLLTGINPYQNLFSTVNTMQMAFLWNVYLTIFWGGVSAIFVLASFFGYRKRLFRFGLITLVLPAFSVFAFIHCIEVRQYYLSILPFGLLSYLGFREIERWMSNYFKLKVRRFVTCGMIVVMILGNYFIMSTLFDVGTEGKDLHHVMNYIQGNYKNPLVLVDSIPNVYSYLRFAYPSTDLGLTREASFLYPNQITDLELLKNKAAYQPIIYIDAYGPSMNWAERIINAFKKDEKESGKTVVINWMRKNNNLELEELVQKGQYTVYLIREKERVAKTEENP